MGAVNDDTVELLARLVADLYRQVVVLQDENRRLRHELHTHTDSETDSKEGNGAVTVG